MAEMRPGPTDLIKTAEIGLVIIGFKVEIPPESKGSIKAARIGQRYPRIQGGIAPGAQGFD